MNETASWAQMCNRCQCRYAVAGPEWRCACGGLLAMAGPPPARLVEMPAPGSQWWPGSLWRYRPALPPLPGGERWGSVVSMGEGLTPLVPGPGPLLFKLDFVSPTGSFKDRGAVVVVAAAAGAGHRRLVTDSSGNAGTAMAAYAGRAGLEAEIFVPATTSPAKLAAIRAHGATVRSVEGPRAAAAEAAQERVVSTGAFYASHVYQPLFTQGTKTLAFEIWEQLGGALPEAVVVPAGNGTLVLGAWLGFGDLLAAGVTNRVPPIVAVQAERCAPLAGSDTVAPTVAEGIAVAAPPRRDEVLAAVHASGGTVITAAESDIAAAASELGQAGLWVEPTAAATLAGWKRWQPPVAANGRVVLVLGGTGRKGAR